MAQQSPPSKLQPALLVSSLQKPLPTNATLPHPGTKKENNMKGAINGIIFIFPLLNLQELFTGFICHGNNMCRTDGVKVAIYNILY